MKKFAVLFSAIALMFAFSATSVVAQNVPTKKSTEKTVSVKSESATPAAAKKADCSDKAKADCSDKSAAKSDCAKTCGEAKAKDCGSATKTASAKPVPAPDVK
jgi:hypothetical protein